MKTHLIAVFIFAIVSRMLLHGIIGEVYVFVVQALDVKFFARCSNVAIFIKEPLEMAIDTC